MIRHGGPEDYEQNEIYNLVFHTLSGAPSAPVEGQYYYNSVNKKVYFWNGTGWIDMGSAPDATAGTKGIVQLAGDLAGSAASPQIAAGVITSADINAAAGILISQLELDPRARGSHTGTQLAATISDLLTAITSVRLDQMSAPTVDLSINGRKVTNVADGTSTTDAVTWGQVQNLIQGLGNKYAAKVAYTSNQALTDAAPSEGGVTPANGESVLLMNQSAPAENGLWLVNTSGAWARPTNANTWAELVSAFVFVEGGSSADNGYLFTVDAGGTLGTTAITIIQFSGAGQITAGAALAKSGNTLDVAVDGASIEVSSDALRVKALGIVAGMLADSAVSLAGTKVTGTLPVASGGTGQTTAKAARETGLSGAGYYSSAIHGAGTTISISQAEHLLRASQGLGVWTQDVATGDHRIDDINVSSGGDVVVTFSASQSANSIRTTIIG